MRIGIGIIVMADLFIRGNDLKAHYTDSGIWSVKLMYTLGWKAGSWSLHALSGEYSWELILFILHFMFAAFLVLGFKTKLSTLLVWLFTISLHNRNIYIQQSGDDLLRLVLFWGLFLKWGNCYSLDSRKANDIQKQATIPNLGYLLLIASVYFFSVSLKTSNEWHADGNAVYYALSLEQLRLPVGDWLYQFPGFLKLFTWLVYYTELILPLLILWPSKKGYLRFTAFLLIILLHTGFGLTLYVGLFFVIGMVSSIGLLPKFVLDKMETTFHLKIKKTSFKKNKPNNWHPVLNTVSVIIIFLSLAINLATVNWFSYELRGEMLYPVNVLRLDQNWGMFSPSVLKKDGWFVYHGMDSIGRQWDLRRNEDYVDYAKPTHIVKMYKSDRWRKLAENLQNDTYTFLRPPYCQFILKDWNRRHPEKKIFTLNLYYMEKESLPDYKTTPAQKKLYCVCNDI
jgi:hypothetical protein